MKGTGLRKFDDSLILEILTQDAFGRRVSRLDFNKRRNLVFVEKVHAPV